MENGEYRVSLEVLFKILSVFEMPMSEFFHEDDAQAPVRDRDHELLRMYHRLTPRLQEEVLDFIQFKLQTEEKFRKGN